MRQADQEDDEFGSHASNDALCWAPERWLSGSGCEKPHNPVKRRLVVDQCPGLIKERFRNPDIRWTVPPLPEKKIPSRSRLRGLTVLRLILETVAHALDLYVSGNIIRQSCLGSQLAALNGGAEKG